MMVCLAIRVFREHLAVTVAILVLIHKQNCLASFVQLVHQVNADHKANVVFLVQKEVLVNGHPMVTQVRSVPPVHPVFKVVGAVKETKV